MDNYEKFLQERIDLAKSPSVTAAYTVALESYKRIMNPLKQVKDFESGECSFILMMILLQSYVLHITNARLSFYRKVGFDEVDYKIVDLLRLPTLELMGLTNMHYRINITATSNYTDG
jgi:hypothetical protein